MRTPKSKNDIKREKPRRSSLNSLLIVCEGSVTEPSYLEEIKRFYNINPANIVIHGERCGSSPKSVVTFAKKESKEDDYDKVFCVFDRDKHDSFDSAIDQISSLNRNIKWPSFIAIISNPCFEFWILLHFRYTTKIYTPIAGKSLCQQVIKDLNEEFPGGYTKGCGNLFSSIREHQERAIKNAKKLKAYLDTTGATSPMTDMHELLLEMISLKKLSNHTLFHTK